MLSWILRQFTFFYKRTTRVSYFSLLVLFLFVFLTGILFFSGSVFAQGASPDPDVDTFGLADFGAATNLGGDSLHTIVSRIVNVMFGMLGTVAVVIILYGGYVYMTAAGKEDNVDRAKKIIINGVIGLTIILSSFAIARFILFALRQATGTGLNPDGRSGQPAFNDFAGTGSLGKVVRDHYPFRDATDVARNTKIAVTFNIAIDPASIIENTNNTCWASDGSGAILPDNPIGIGCAQNERGNIPFFGDCLTPPEGTPFSWEEHCDKLKSGAINIEAISGEGPDLVAVPIAGAAALTVYEGEAQENFSFVFRPYEPLGNSRENVNYRVNITTGVNKASDNTSALRLPYLWNFKTGTTIDISAPTVSSVYPEDNQVNVPRNSLLQINFSEAMDPLSVAGLLSSNSVFTNILAANTSVDSSTISGQWRVANAYRTVEFLPDTPCGSNSCGETIYCLDLTCLPGDANCTNNFQALARTAYKRGNEDAPFEAVPFTGITDMAGNALDGANIGVADQKPSTPADLHTIDVATELVPDNFEWSFSVKNFIDKAAPNVRRVRPGIDAEAVPSMEPIRILFNREISAFSLYNLSLSEYPVDNRVDTVWVRPVANVITEEIRGRAVKMTEAVLQHREFGPNGVDYFYFPVVPTTIKSLTQNCLYPGRGPVTTERNITPSPVCEYIVDEDNRPISINDGNGGNANGAGCVQVFSNDGSKDTGCVQTSFAPGHPTFPNVTSTTEACLSILGNPEVSIVAPEQP